MTHQQIITEAYDKCGMIYTLRTSPDDPRYTYLVLAGNENRKKYFESMSLQALTASESFIEFRDGELASY